MFVCCGDLPRPQCWPASLWAVGGHTYEHWLGRCTVEGGGEGRGIINDTASLFYSLNVLIWYHLL